MLGEVYLIYAVICMSIRLLSGVMCVVSLNLHSWSPGFLNCSYMTIQPTIIDLFASRSASKVAMCLWATSRMKRRQ